MTQKIDETKQAPGFMLLEEDHGPAADASPTASASLPQAGAEAAAHPQAPAQTCTSTAERPAFELPSITRQDYSPPTLGGARPLAETSQAELDVVSANSKDLAVDVQEKPQSASKVKLGAIGAVIVVASVLGYGIFGPSPAPTAAPGAAATQSQPGATDGLSQPSPTGPASPGPVIDTGNTAEIPREIGEIEMIEQWTLATPAEQSCAAEILSPYLQAICKKAGQARYFQCAPDGFHWDYRIDGCAQL
jgi:hypothetical protein